MHLASLRRHFQDITTSQRSKEEYSTARHGGVMVRTIEMAGSQGTLASGVGNMQESVTQGGVVTATARPPAIAATGLRKSYGDQVVLDGIDLEIAAGTIFALLGSNGA